jgi:pyrimidine operon attenuation protein/uracil phosphoribosyltransferase
VGKKKYILDQVVAEKKLRRMAFEILESNPDEQEIILAGIRESGSVVAKCIQQLLQEIGGIKTTLITITLDKRMPASVDLSTEVDFNDKVVIIVDDVANSGRTLMYALKPFLGSRPKKIQALVLVERSHNSFPVHPDYTGLSVATTLQENIIVEVDGDRVTGAYLE